MTVPVVGALLIFTLMIGPPAAARCFTDRPGVALAGSVVLALVTIWSAIAAAYETNWPVGFFVGIIERAVVRSRTNLRRYRRAFGDRSRGGRRSGRAGQWRLGPDLRCPVSHPRGRP